jgi:U3 small nucleolar RNA-associated protein 6
MHPNTPAFYILAAQTELERHAPSAARGLLQRGIRMNAEDEGLWVEYVRLEMNFVEGLRRRWSVLGISVGGGKGEERETVDIDQEEEASADRAREQILQGAIVKSVLDSAAKGTVGYSNLRHLITFNVIARPTISLFTSLEDLIRTYPTPIELKTSLIDYLHTLITHHLPNDAQAIIFAATRPLRPIPEGTVAEPDMLDLEGETLVDAIQRTNEALLAAADPSHEYAVTSDSSVDGSIHVRLQVQKAYAAFVEEWTTRLEGEHPDLADLVSLLPPFLHSCSAPFSTPFFGHYS